MGRNRFISLANITPPMVSNTKATRPRPMMTTVPTVKKAPAFILAAMVRPSTMVIRLARVVWAVWERLSSFRHSRSRLPNISMPTRETEAGATKPAITITMIGNRMRVRRETDCGL